MTQIVPYVQPSPVDAEDAQGNDYRRLRIKGAATGYRFA